MMSILRPNDFPPLSSSASVVMPKSMIREKARLVFIEQEKLRIKEEKKIKHAEYLVREEKREQRKKEQKEIAEKEYVANMCAKYGPFWYRQVCNTSDDSPSAERMRYDEEEEEDQRQREIEPYVLEAYREEEELYRKKQEERKALRALMPPDQALEDEDAEADEEDDAFNAAWLTNEFYTQFGK